MAPGLAGAELPGLEELFACQDSPRHGGLDRVGKPVADQGALDPDAHDESGRCALIEEEGLGRG